MRWMMIGALALGGVGCRASSPASAPVDGGARAPAEPPTLPPLTLDGRWRVLEPDGAEAEWTVRGTELVRRRGERTERGWIEQPAPGRAIVRLPKGRVWFMGVARDGDRLWIGPGRGGQRLPGGGWVVADNGLVAAGPRGGCQWYRQRVKGGYHPPQAVTCTVEGERLRYTLPRRTGGRAPEARTVRLVGQAVVGEGLQPMRPLAD